MAEPLVLLSELEAVTLGIGPGLSTGTGSVIDRIRLTCRLGPVSQGEGGVATSLLVQIQYIESSGEVWASEWLQLPVQFREQEGAWTCQVGPDWCWSTDWPT